MRTLRPQHLVACLIAALLAAVASVASAETYPGGVRLSYRRSPGAAACLDEESLRDAIAARLDGVDPFAPDGAWRIDVLIMRRKSVFSGEIAVVDPEGARRGKQELVARSCRELAGEIALTLSIALRPLRRPAVEPISSSAAEDHAARPSAAPAAASPALPAPAARVATPGGPTRPTRPRPKRSAPPPAAPPRFELGAGPLLASGFAPTLSFGFSGFVGIRWPVVSLLAEMRGDLPVTSEQGTGANVTTSWLGGSVASCLHERWVFGCGLVTAGVSRTHRTSAGDKETVMACAGVGLRAGLEVPFSSRVAGQLSADLLANVVRQHPHLARRDEQPAGATAQVLSLRLVTFF